MIEGFLGRLAELHRAMRSAGRRAVPLGVYRALRRDRVSAALQLHRHPGGEDARVRALPPPFAGWCTVSSDADAPNMEGFLSTGRILREQLALPISDSTFPHFMFNQGLVEEERVVAGFPDFGRGDVFDLETFIERCGEWLRYAYRGRVDTVHGWLLRQQVRIGDDVIFEEDRASRPGSRRPSRGLFRKTVGQMSRTRNRLAFHLPEGWHPRVPPRYLVFNYRAPTTTGMVKLVFLDGDDAAGEVNLTELPQGAPQALVPYIIDMEEVIGRDPELLRRVEVEIRIQGRPHLVELRRPMMLSWLREDIREQMTLFEALNLRFAAYTSHGGGYNIGHYRTTNLDAADPRGMAEVEENPYFALDLFKDFGLRFFNTASNTSRRDAVSLADFLFPRVINNGEAVYDFNRFLHIPKTSDGADDYGPFELFGGAQNPSLANFAGWQVSALLRQIDEGSAGQTGGAVYTHLLSKCLDDPGRLDRSVSGLFSEETRAALEDLASRYYGLGDSPGNRVFVAPLALLLRYAQVLRRLPEVAVYDPRANVVHVSSWTDPVTGELIPGDVGGGDGLRYATFYVREAATARLFVDGNEHHALIRNEDDGLEGESVTVADAGTPTPLVGRVNLHERPDRDVATSGCSLTFDYEAGCHRLVVEDDQAWLSIHTSGATLADHGAVRVMLEGDLGPGSWTLQLESEDGEVWGLGVGDAAQRPGMVRASGGPEEHRHDVVVPFHRLTETAPGNAVPRAGLVRIRLTVLGAAVRSVGIRAISLLRDNPRVQAPRCIVGGRVAPGTEVTRVLMGWEARSFETRVLRGGWFVFLDRVPRGTVVWLRGVTQAGEDVVPDCGPRMEVLTDTLDVEFSSAASDPEPEEAPTGHADA